MSVSPEGIHFSHVTRERVCNVRDLGEKLLGGVPRGEAHSIVLRTDDDSAMAALYKPPYKQQAEAVFGLADTQDEETRNAVVEELTREARHLGAYTLEVSEVLPAPKNRQQAREVADLPTVPLWLQSREQEFVDRHVDHTQIIHP